MDSLDSLRVFHRVTELGGFARAGDSRGLSKGVVSVAVRRLEAQLGTQLLQRTTRKVQLTDDGRAFYERSREVFADMDALHGLFRHDASTLTGRLRVDMSSGVARQFVVPALPEFLARHPGLSIEIGVTERHVDLVREGYDCVLRIGSLADSSLVGRRLGEMRLVNCASPAYLRQYGVPQSLDDLAQHRLVHYVQSFGQRNAVFDYCTPAGAASLPMRADVAVNSGAAYEAAAVAGLGIVQVPELVVRHLLASGALVEVLCDWRPAPMPLTLLSAHRRHQPPRLRAFADWVAALLQPHLLHPLPAAPNAAQAS